ncbi:hypothetical protein ACFU9X_46150, partial [Streptomyces atratus]|uniref:hypothetical protein n=1 Tax=Streptomyces atratus TaxID=1893 RepID=UPI0036B7B460
MVADRTDEAAGERLRLGSDALRQRHHSAGATLCERGDRIPRRSLGERLHLGGDAPGRTAGPRPSRPQLLCAPARSDFCFGFRFGVRCAGGRCPRAGKRRSGLLCRMGPRPEEQPQGRQPAGEQHHLQRSPADRPAPG